jgi:hypothetical protein
MFSTKYMKFKATLTALVVAMLLTVGISSPAMAAQPVHQSVSAAQSATVRVGTITPGSGLCVSAINGSRASVYVAAFALGYCPTWSFLQTPWGRNAVNWALNYYCKVPWLVRAATWGQYSRC